MRCARLPLCCTGRCLSAVGAGWCVRSPRTCLGGDTPRTCLGATSRRSALYSCPIGCPAPAPAPSGALPPRLPHRVPCPRACPIRCLGPAPAPIRRPGAGPAPRLGRFTSATSNSLAENLVQPATTALSARKSYIGARHGMARCPSLSQPRPPTPATRPLPLPHAPLPLPCQNPSLKT